MNKSKKVKKSTKKKSVKIIKKGSIKKRSPYIPLSFMDSEENRLLKKYTIVKLNIAVKNLPKNPNMTLYTKKPTILFVLLI